MTKRTSQIDQWQDPSARAVAARAAVWVQDANGFWGTDDDPAALAEAYEVEDASGFAGLDDAAVSGLRVRHVGDAAIDF